MLIHDSDSGKTTAIDYRETAPLGASRDMFLDAEGNAEAASWALVWLPEGGEPVAESYVNLIPTAQGGTHVNAVRKYLMSYQHIDPTLVGNETRILVSELSGVSNVSALLGEKFGIELPIVKAVHEVLFDGKAPLRAIRELMSRVPRSEAEPER